MDLIVQEFYRLGALHTYIGGIATVVFLLIHIYRLPQAQARIPKKWRWASLSFVWQHALLILLAGLGGMLSAYAADMSGWDAVKTALAAVQAIILTGAMVRK